MELTVLGGGTAPASPLVPSLAVVRDICEALAMEVLCDYLRV
jgi:hypothetical protein